MKRKFFLFIFINLLFIACQDKNKEEAINSIKEWMGKEILFPQGGTLKFTIIYEADKPGYFRKSLRVYGNMKESPMKLFVKGDTN